MPDPVIFDNLAATVNGELWGRLTSIEVSYPDTHSVIALLGTTEESPIAIKPGHRFMVINFGDLVSRDGPQFDLIDFYLTNTKVTLGLTLIGSGQRLLTEGWFTAPGMKAAHGQNLQLGVSFTGKAARFE